MKLTNGLKILMVAMLLLGAIGAVSAANIISDIEVKINSGAPLIVYDPYIDIRYDGATGDGVTDDTINMQTVINTAHTMGLPVEFPCGDYLVSQLTIYSGMTITGKGNCTTIRRNAYTTSGVIIGSNLTDVTLKDFDIVTGSSSKVGYALLINGGLNSEGRTNIDIDNVNIHTRHAGSNGIFIRSLYGDLRGVEVKNSNIISSTATGTDSRGLIIGAGAFDGYEFTVDNVLIDGYTTALDAYITGTIQDSRIVDSTFRNADRWGARLYHAGDMRIDNCVFENNEVGAWFDNSMGTYLTAITNSKFINNSVVGAYSEEWTNVGMTNCLFQGNGYGFWLASGDNVNIDACRFINNSDDGMLVDRAANLTGTGTHYDLANTYYIRNVKVTDSIFSLNGKNGVTMGGTQRYFEFDGCSFDRNGIDAVDMAASNYSGVYIRKDGLNKTSNIVIIKNSVVGNTSGDGGVDGQQKYGVRVKDSSVINSLLLYDNVFLHLTTALQGNIIPFAEGNRWFGVTDYTNLSINQNLYVARVYANWLYTDEYIYHNDDSDTSIRLLDDRIVFSAGGLVMIDAQEGTTDTVKFSAHKLQVGAGTLQVNLTMTSPNANEWCCGVSNAGTWSCAAGAC